LTLGYNYRIKLIAYNDVGYVVGNIISVIAANVPDTPANAPDFDKTETNATQIRVTYEKIIGTGGSNIISY
jgi:hypothetical protein